MDDLSINDNYAEQYKGLKKIIYEELLPYFSMVDQLSEDFNSDADEISKKNPLFIYINNSLWSSVFITFSKLLDGNRSKRNIIHFVDFCEKHINEILLLNGNTLSQEIINKHKNLIQQNQNAIKNICARRDKYFAHNDPAYFLDSEKIEDDFPITKNELIEVFNCFVTILSDHQELNEGSRTIVWELPYKQAMYNLLHNSLEKQ